MCNNYSESGQSCGFVPCEAYKRMEEENEFMGNRVGLLEAENAALRQDNMAFRAENANLSMAHGPGNHTDWMLTRASKYEQLHKDLDALRQDRDRLAGLVEKADMLAREVKTGAKREWAAYKKYQEARHAG